MLAGPAFAVPQRIISSSFFEPFLFPQSGPMLTTAIAGVPNFFHGGPADVRVPNWNQLQGPFGLELDLFDSQGFGSTVDARWIATNVSSNNYLNPVINGDSMMMNGHLFSSTLGAIGLATVTVEDLAGSFDIASGYEVWVYADAEGLGQTESLFVDDGIHVGMAIPITDTITDLGGGRQFDFTTDYDEATTDGLGVWVRFTGLTGPTFTIEARSILDGQSAYINGFQIIGHPIVPEPSSAGLLVLGVSIAAALRRSTQRRC
jgi:hypothetical protein